MLHHTPRQWSVKAHRGKVHAFEDVAWDCPTQDITVTQCYIQDRDDDTVLRAFVAQHAA